MRLTLTLLLPALAITLATHRLSFASHPSPHNCVAFTEAGQHVGTAQCVRGTVLHVDDGRNGAKLLNFCAPTKNQTCPFTVIVFPHDLKKMGDIRELEGRQIEIKGTIQDHDGRAQIILRRSQQLGESAFRLFPPVPADYDVERQGNNRSGRYSLPKAKKSTTKQGEPVPIEDPGEPQ
ncbi:MAG: hypothetical protein WCA97_06045 [Terriglobales bacterium]|jgi:hypothetical protein